MSARLRSTFTGFKLRCCTYLLDDDMCVGGLVQKMDGFHDAQRWRVKIVAQIIVHNWVFVQELICRVAQGNDPHMTALHAQLG